MAWTASFVVTAFVTVGLWRRHAVPSSELLATSTEQARESVSTERFHLNKDPVEDVEALHVDAGEAPPAQSAAQTLPALTMEPQVEISDKKLYLDAEQPFATVAFEARGLCFDAAAPGELWCPKPSHQEVIDEAELPVSSSVQHDKILLFLTIWVMLCCCECCKRCFSRTWQNEAQVDDGNEEEEGMDASSEDEILQVVDAEVQTEANFDEVSVTAKQEASSHEEHDDLENRLKDLPSPVRSVAVDRVEKEEADATHCSSAVSSPRGRVEAEDDLARAERLLKEKAWVLDDACATIFEEEEDEHDFHRNRSEILGCFARAFRDQLSIREAGEALLDDIDRLEEEKRQAVGDVAYWRTLYEDLASKQNDVNSPVTSVEE